MPGLVFAGPDAAPRPPIRPGELHGLLLLGIGGTLIEGPEELTSLSDPRLITPYHGMRELIQTYRTGGWVIALLCNQPGVAEKTVHHKHVQVWLQHLVQRVGNTVDFALYCPHSELAEKSSDRLCSCRKPMYGLTVIANLMAEQLFGCSFPHPMQLVIGGEKEKQMAQSANLKFRPADNWRVELLTIKGSALTN
jgi:hypothetical protein